MAEQELKDISIIDALPALGGQLMALYPEKYIFDVAGFPKVLAKDLVRDMSVQALQFGATTHLGQVVTGLRRVEQNGGSHFVLETSEDEYPTRTLVIAAGIGAFEARKLGIEGEDRFEEKDSTSRCWTPNSSRGNESSSLEAATRRSTGRSICRESPNRSC